VREPSLRPGHDLPRRRGWVRVVAVRHAVDPGRLELGGEGLILGCRSGGVVDRRRGAPAALLLGQGQPPLDGGRVEVGVGGVGADARGLAQVERLSRGEVVPVGQIDDPHGAGS
jgi:hypothetical protein